MAPQLFMYFSSRKIIVLASLFVLSACSGGSSTSSTVPNRAPSVNAGADATIRLPVVTVSLDGTVSDDGLPAGAAVSTAWIVQSGPAGASFANVNAVDTTVTFVSEGTYVLQLTADDTALQGSDTVTIIVEADPAPVADAGGPYTGVEGAAVALDGSASTDANNDIVLYEWDLDNDGAYDDATGVNTAFNVFSSGVFTIGLRVTDGDGVTDSDTTTVTVTAPPTRGPVAHWTLDETSGTTAADSSVNDNIGTLVNGPMRTAGQINGGLEFDGVDDYMDVPDGSSLDLASELTISAWINPRTLGNNSQGRIIDKAGEDGTIGYVFRMNSSNRIGIQQSGVVGGVDSSNNAITLNAWNHVVGIVRSGTNVTLFVNGLTVGSGNLTSSIAANSQTLRIGMRHDGGQAFDGIMDEIRIYNRALTTTEIGALYQQGTNKFSIDDRVQTTIDLNVRETPSTTGNLLGIQPTGAPGTVISGPVTADGFTWWNVDYDNAPNGWSMEDRLEMPVSTTYYPSPEGAGGWRSLVAINNTPTTNQKTDIRNIAGIDWDRLEAAWDYSESLAVGGTVVAMRNGWIAGEWGSTANYDVASVTKSLTSLAVARMMDLSDRGLFPRPIGFESLVHQYLPPAFGNSDPLKTQIKFKHLLTMSPGIQPADPDLLTMNERLTYAMDASPEMEWVYSSLPPNLLSMTIQDVVGQSFGNFFNTEIASAVGASPLGWETIDGGFTKGAAGASVNARDLARIAYLTLQNGLWDNGSGLKQIVSASRVSATTQWAPFLASAAFRVSPGSPFPIPADSPNHFGYLWWTNRTQVALGPDVPVDAYYMHGFRDNLAIVVPSKNLIVIRLSSGGPGTDTTFRSQFMSLVMTSLIN